jgi:transcriptional regulator with XRE-family HTH domain
MTIKEITAYRLKQARLYRNMSMEALGNAIDVSGTTINTWELFGIPKIEKTIPKLAKVLNFPLEYFTAEPDRIIINPYISIFIYNGLITPETAIKLEKDMLNYPNA